jgi:aerobic-type carbon monoxide dehydrogenase small subunit (CoxS/CutS family)
MKPGRVRTQHKRSTMPPSPLAHYEVDDVEVDLVVNAVRLTSAFPPRTTLACLLRDELGLVGTKLGCNEGTCGSCTVLVDGAAVYSCMLLALDVAGRDVRTIEGVGDRRNPHVLQQAFACTYAAQCGYCTPGMILTALELLASEPAPSRDEVASAISGNLCKCAAYAEIVDAVVAAAETLRAQQGQL